MIVIPLDKVTSMLTWRHCGSWERFRKLRTRNWSRARGANLKAWADLFDGPAGSLVSVPVHSPPAVHSPYSNMDLLLRDASQFACSETRLVILRYGRGSCDFVAMLSSNG